MLIAVADAVLQHLGLVHGAVDTQMSCGSTLLVVICLGFRVSCFDVPRW
jgi:hypothetical protein